MLERLEQLPPGIDGVRAVGKVSREDYEQVFGPLLDEARRDNRRIRFLYELGPEFTGLTPGAAWEDARLGLGSMRLFEGCAIVTNRAWVRDAVQLGAFVMPCPVRVFGVGEHEAAARWLAGLPAPRATRHGLIPDKGVIVVEVDGPLGPGDFDAIAATADPWIEANGALAGLVLHARSFPGWETLGGLVRHLRFVREHHRKIRRVALAVDGTMASLAPRLAEHFVAAEVRSYAYDDLDAAITWAARAEVPAGV